MGFLTPPPDSELYAVDEADQGYVANYTKLFALRPDVYAAWENLSATVRAGMDLRRYELVTLAAARRLKSSYCALAHGGVLRDRFYDSATVRAIATDHRHAGLGATDIAIMDFADKVALDATSITAADVDILRGHGLSDEDVFQVVLAVSVRCFFSTTLDATGTEPDAAYRSSVAPDLAGVLTVGRQIATS